MNTTKFDAIIFLVDYTSFSEGINSYNLTLSGKTLLNHVTRALSGAPHETVAYDGETSVLETVRRRGSGYRYTVALFSDTPLVRAEAIISVLEHMAKKGLAYIKLKRGYIFDNLKFDEIGDIDALPALNHSGADEDYLAVTDYRQLSAAGKILRERINAYHQSQGVNIIDPATTYIDSDAVIGRDVTIFPSNTIRGASKIDKGATLRENNVIEDSTVGENAVVTESRVESSIIHAEATVGPFAHLRPKTVIGRHAKIGNFVEVKNSSVGSGTKISHLSYVGDAVIEAECNIGCGVTIANYDGKNKNRTYIGEGTFIGSNSVLIAPLTIGARSFVAAGSAITESVEAGALAIGRARQVNKPGYAKKHLE